MKWRKQKEALAVPVVQIRNGSHHPFGMLGDYVPLRNGEVRLYRAVREAVPVVDAAIYKLIRMSGGVTVSCGSRRAEAALAEFLRTVPVGRGQFGINAVFLKIRVAESELCRIRSIVSERSLSGLAVTMPHKKAIIPLLDGIDETAAECGSVNIVTISNNGSTLIGHNTDGDGLINALRETGAGLSGAQVVILGHGGAANGAAAALLRAGAEIRFVTRDKKNGIDMLSAIKHAETESRLLSSADILINATPIGMHNMNNDCSDYEETSFLNCLKPSCIIADMVYRTNGTKLVQDAVHLGLTAFGGERMLFHQGKLAFKLWTGLEYIPES